MICATAGCCGLEERANKLPMEMVGPLGLFMFPVILGIAMLPG